MIQPVSKSVFVSHAVKDEALAATIVELIEGGMGVPEAEIFCSSLEGYGIPTGENFVTYIKGQLIAPKVVVLLLTPAYFESKFCLSELGAAWIKSHAIFPILVPPLGYDDVKDVLLGVQVTKVGDDIGYNQLRDRLQKEVTCNTTSTTKWDTKRRNFTKALATLLPNIAPASKVSAEAHAAVQASLEDAQAELDSNEQELERLKAQLAATEALKDREAVEVIQEEFSDDEDDGEDDVSTQFNALTDEVKAFRSTFRSKAVMTFALSDHYGHAYTIDWQNDRSEFESAGRYKFIDLEDHERVRWTNKTMKEMGAKLNELDTFVAEHRRALTKTENDAPLDPAAQDFWEYHYEL